MGEQSRVRRTMPQASQSQIRFVMSIPKSLGNILSGIFRHILKELMQSRDFR
jgi:hypothetical protein